MMSTSAEDKVRPLTRRSCIACHRRKIKCDRSAPCVNCQKSGLTCHFPDRPIRRPRKPASQDAAKLLERLRQLEGVVEKWSIPTEATARTRASLSPEDDRLVQDSPLGSASSPETQQLESGSSQRLLGNDNQSRFVQSDFWASLSDGVEDLTALLMEESEVSEAAESPPVMGGAYPNFAQAFLMGFRSSMADLSGLHPDPATAQRIVEIYTQRVDLRCKILHRPSMRRAVLEVAQDPTAATAEAECLSFAVCFAAVLNSSPEDCVTLFQESQDDLVSRYRFATEQALAKCEFITSSKIVTLESLVIYMECLHLLKEDKMVWAMTGIATRLAQSLGLHRDGASFSLSPYTAELRRRLWWQIYAIDTRTAEDLGIPPTISHNGFNTRIPTNINDADLHPDMTEAPSPRSGWAEMTISLCRYEVCHAIRQINRQPQDMAIVRGPERELSLEEKERVIEGCSSRLEKKYLSTYDMSNPVMCGAAALTRLMLAKMWVTIYHPLLGNQGGEGHSAETRQRLFVSSIEVLEYSKKLESTKFMPRNLLLRLYLEWQSVGAILSELRSKGRGPLVERAWKAIDAVSPSWETDTPNAGPNKGAFWRPMRKMLEEARRVREKALAEEALSGSMDMEPDLSRELSALSTNGSAEPLDFNVDPALDPWHDIILDPMDAATIGLQNINGINDFSEFIGGGFPWQDGSQAAPAFTGAEAAVATAPLHMPVDASTAPALSSFTALEDPDALIAQMLDVQPVGGEGQALSAGADSDFFASSNTNDVRNGDPNAVVDSNVFNWSAGLK